MEANRDAPRVRSSSFVGRVGSWLKRLGGLLLLFLSVPIGVLAAVGGFFGGAFVTSSVVLLKLAGALALVVLAGGLSWLACRWLLPRGGRGWLWLRRMLPVLLTGGTLLFAGLVAESFLFRPMDVTYVPQKPTDGTRYWDLPTGSRLAYALTPTQGDAEDEPASAPVVMLHGGPGTPGDLTPDRVELALAGAGFDVYSYHQVGAGLSDRLGDVTDYTVGRHVADLEAVRKEIGADKLILVGGSWGATLGAHYAAAHPGRVERMVFDSPGAIWAPAFAGEPISEGPENEVIGEAVTPRFLVVMALQRINITAAENFAPDREMSAFFQRLVGRIIASDAAGCDAEAGDLPEGPRIPEGFGYYANVATTASVDRSEDPRPALRNVDVPVLVVRGECDRIRWPVAREYRDLFPNATLVVVDDAGHSVRESRPGLSAEIFRSFLLGETLPLKPYRETDAPA